MGTTTGQTPFLLVYGCEAVLPFEIRIPIAKHDLITEQQNRDEMINDLETIEELRDAVLVGTIAKQHIITRSLNKNMQAKVFNEGD